MISCSEAVRRLWDYLDQELDRGEHVQVEDHLALCRRCCGEAEFAGALRDLLRSAAGPPLPKDVESHLVGFLDTLDPPAPRQDEPSGEQAPEGQRPEKEPL